jgi:hypothetical protein
MVVKQNVQEDTEDKQVIKISDRVNCIASYT